MTDADNVLATLDELREMGVRVALDDFGTGYSSLAYLCRFRPDKVKIDQSFVRDMAKNGTSLAIIKAVRALAKELQIDMLVEGVETAGAAGNPARQRRRRGAGISCSASRARPTRSPAWCRTRRNFPAREKSTIPTTPPGPFRSSGSIPTWRSG